MTGFFSSENWILDVPARVRNAIEAKMVTIEVPAGSAFKRAGDAPDGLFQVERVICAC